MGKFLSGLSDHSQFLSGSPGSYFHHLTPVCVLLKPHPVTVIQDVRSMHPERLFILWQTDRSVYLSLIHLSGENLYLTVLLWKRSIKFFNQNKAKVLFLQSKRFKRDLLPLHTTMQILSQLNLMKSTDRKLSYCKLTVSVQL